MGAPEALVKRSAEARAKASGVSVDDILSAWAGGGSVAVATAPAPSTPAEPADAPVEAVPEVAAAAVVIAPTPVAAVVPAAMVEEAPEEFEPAPLRQRVAVAGRVGMWTGVVLGVIGLLAASPWTLPNASMLGEEGDFSPALLVEKGRLVLVTALFSIVFGAIIATLSRAATGWVVPGGRLGSGGRTATLLGGAAGGILGLISGSVLNSFGQPVENAPELVQLPVVAAIFVVLIGGGLLGWLVAALVQALGVPEGTHDEETRAVKSRLGGAIGVPLAGLAALALLVLPLAVVLVRSNHLAKGGAALLAVIASASILAVASLSASKPGMKISRGEFLLALGGIAVVVTMVFAVMLARNPSAGHEEEPAGTEEAAEGEEATVTTLGEGVTTTVAPYTLGVFEFEGEQLVA